MDRRAYLTALGAAAAAVSGCSEGDSTGASTRTATADGTPAERVTATAEQPDPTPRVTDAGLLPDRDSFTSMGDIESVGRGGILVVGAEYELPVSDGSARGLVEVRLLDGDGTELSTDSEEIDAVVADDSESYSDSTSFAFDTTDWEQGSYTAEVLVNAEAYGTTSSAEVPVELVEPLGEGEVELFLAEFPDDAVAGEEFSLTLGFRNLTDRDSSLVTDTATFDPASHESVTISNERRENIPANDEILVESTIGVPYADSYTYRLGDVGIEVTFSVGLPAE